MTEQATGLGLQFFTCEVRDIRDPDRAGKVKVMVHGHHNMQDTPIPDADLPWAYPVMNNTASLNSIGETTKYLPGTCLFGFWMDPETKQIPIVLGSLHKAGIAKINGKDPEPEGDIDEKYRSTPGNEYGNPGNIAANQRTNEQYALFKEEGDQNWNRNPNINTETKA